MYQKLFFFLLMACIGQLLPMAGYSYSTKHLPLSCVKQSTVQSRYIQKTSGELQRISYPVTAVARVMRNLDHSFCEVAAVATSCLERSLPLQLYGGTAFSKDYIAHIYPSHHFW